MNINELWNEIKNSEGKTFYTVRGLPFTYELVNSFKLAVDRNGRNVGYINKSDFEYIMENPNESTTFFQDAMRTASYALAIFNKLYR
ncbi:MAG: hypothetical protein K6E24_00230 [bacterium]|nr:hypothetical protein [bacterium]